MKVFRGLPNAQSRAPCALAIGNFDGVHRGHQALLTHVSQAATQLGLHSAVMTFEPHPREFFAHSIPNSKNIPARIANLRDKLQSLARADISRVIVEHFNAQFANQSAQDFVHNVLVQGLHVKWLIVGEDFRYGAKRVGDINTLIQAGHTSGFEVVILPNVMHQATRISSSAIRTALVNGDFDHAKELLGHGYSISGHVIHGKKLGQVIGFPTLNMRITHPHPALSGIFIVKVHGLSESAYPAVASIGSRPTVDQSGRILLEVHVLDYSAQCYGKIVRVEFLKKLRDEKFYENLDQLTLAIAQDVEQARAYFKTHFTPLT